MRRLVLAALVLAVGWIAAAPSTAASVCILGPDMTVESFARGTPYGWPIRNESDRGYLVLGRVAEVLPWAGERATFFTPDWEYKIAVTAAVGAARVSPEISVADRTSQPSWQRGDARAFVIYDDGGVLIPSGCFSPFEADDLDSLAAELEVIAAETGTPFARPYQGMSWRHETMLLVGIVTVVGLVDAVRRGASPRSRGIVGAGADRSTRAQN